MPGELKDIIWNCFLGLLSIFIMISFRWIYGVNKFKKDNDQMHADLNREWALVKKDVSYVKTDVSNMRSEMREVKGMVFGLDGKINTLQGSINTLSDLVLDHIKGDK